QLELVPVRLSTCFCESDGERRPLSLPASARPVSRLAGASVRAFLSTGVSSRRSTGSPAALSPSRLRFTAAFSSLSRERPHTSQLKTRSFRLSVSLITPQPEQSFDDG